MKGRLKCTTTISWVKILGLSKNLCRVFIKYCSLVSRTTRIKCCFSSQPVSERGSVLDLFRLCWYRCSDIGLPSSRNDNSIYFLPQKVINYRVAAPLTWSSFTFTNLIYFSKWHSITILSRPLKQQFFLEGNIQNIYSSLIITTSICHL